eukprot:8567358-Pyramimonas_sp.AAC.1
MRGVGVRGRQPPAGHEMGPFRGNDRRGPAEFAPGHAPCMRRWPGCSPRPWALCARRISPCPK